MPPRRPTPPPDPAELLAALVRAPTVTPEAGAALDGPLLLDGELVPWREGSVLDFAALQTRLGRVRPSAELLAEVPVALVAFDVLHLNGRDLLDEPLRARRAALEALRLPERTAERILIAHLATALGKDVPEVTSRDERA